MDCAPRTLFLRPLQNAGLCKRQRGRTSATGKSLAYLAKALMESSGLEFTLLNSCNSSLRGNIILYMDGG